MISHDQVDLDLLQQSCAELRQYFIETNNLERKPVEIFIALFDLTMEYINAGVDASKMIFDAEELCTKSHNHKDDYPSAKDFVNRHRKAFDKLIEDNIEKIEHQFRLNNIKYLPTIKNTNTSGGIRSLFYLGLKSLSGELKHDVSISQLDKTNKNYDITYTVPKLPKTPTWAKPLLSIEMIGWKFKTYIGLPIAFVVISYFLILWNVFNFSQLSLFITILLFGVFIPLFLLLMPFYEAIEKRIGIAPTWLLNLSTETAQLRYQKTDKFSANGKPVRVLELVVYKAECSICGNEVSIKKGMYRNQGRLVGICEESPREHVFSFDHITKKGKLLNN